MEAGEVRKPEKLGSIDTPAEHRGAQGSSTHHEPVHGEEVAVERAFAHAAAIEPALCYIGRHNATAQRNELA